MDGDVRLILSNNVMLWPTDFILRGGRQHLFLKVVDPMRYIPDALSFIHVPILRVEKRYTLEFQVQQELWKAANFNTKPPRISLE